MSDLFLRNMLADKARELIKLIFQNTESELLVFATENREILIKILTEDFLGYVEEETDNGLSILYLAVDILIDSHINLVEIIFKLAKTEDLLHPHNLWRFCGICAWKDSIDVLKLIYSLNLYSPEGITIPNGMRSIDSGVYKKNLNARINNNLLSSLIIHDACISGGIKVLQFLLDCNTNVNEINEYYQTPLICAAGSGNLTAVKLLVKYGANPNIVSDECLGIVYVGALSIAIHEKYWDIAEYLYPLVSNLDELDNARSFLEEYLSLDLLELNYTFLNLVKLPPRCSEY
jgi:Ankyrin repeats (3 copies)